MSGKRFLPDTNAVVALLRAKGGVLDALQDADWVGVSIITQLEFLSFSGLTKADADLFGEFLDQVAVVPLTSQDEVLIDTAVRIRKRHRLKLPDAIIAASAVVNDASLVSADTEFDRVTSLSRVALAD